MQQLDLGQILLKNEILPAGKEEVDKMTINVERLNMQTFQGAFKSTLFLHTNIDLTMLRPISLNEDHEIPDIELSIGIPKFYFDFREKIVDLIFGILSQNFQEPVASLDVSELKQSTIELEKSGIFQPAPTIETKAITGPARKTLVLSANLGQVGLSVSRGEGVDANGRDTPIANFSLNGMNANLSMLSDGSLDLLFSMKAIVMEDTRATSQNQFKRVYWEILFG